MKVLRIELEGLTTSFRYPHFLVGRQPSYRMPPPSTIYGLICSAVGEWIEPKGINFGYYFTYKGIGDDLEHIHLAVMSVSKKFDKEFGYIKNLEAEVNPIKREILLAPKMILYIDIPNKLDYLYKSFYSPKYPIILGRSQDLFSCRKVEIIDLKNSEEGYIEKTLLPWSFALKENLPGIVVLMPKFINPANRIEIIWDKYVICEYSRVLYQNTSKKVLQIDMDSDEYRGKKRIIIWHSFVNEND